MTISHGIAADRDDFSELAQHLASYGFAVTVLNHPGSDRQHFLNLLRGMIQQITEPNEFVHRPLDVSYLIDQLEQLNQSDSELRGRLNLRQIGVIGHSLGGYTALALAGAEMNFELLQRECDRDRQDLNTANLSMPLQCEALKTTTDSHSLQDSRVQGYLQALSLAFAQVYVAEQSECQDYLRASYTQSISQSPLKLTLLNALTVTHLSQTLEGSCPGRYLAQENR